MIERCAARVSDDGVVVELIVGEADWAVDNLGGTWMQCERNYSDPANDSCPTLGDKWDAEKRKFVPTIDVAAEVAKREVAVAKLRAIGLTGEDIAALGIR